MNLQIAKEQVHLQGGRLRHRVSARCEIKRRPFQMVNMRRNLASRTGPLIQAHAATVRRWPSLDFKGSRWLRNVSVSFQSKTKTENLTELLLLLAQAPAMTSMARGTCTDTPSSGIMRSSSDSTVSFCRAITF